MDNNWIEECYSTYYKQYFKGMKYKKSAWIDYGDQESHEHCLFVQSESVAAMLLITINRHMNHQMSEHGFAQIVLKNFFPIIK